MTFPTSLGLRCFGMACVWLFNPAVAIAPENDAMTVDGVVTVLMQ